MQIKYEDKDDISTSYVVSWRQLAKTEMTHMLMTRLGIIGGVLWHVCLPNQDGDEGLKTGVEICFTDCSSGGAVNLQEVSGDMEEDHLDLCDKSRMEVEVVGHDDSSYCCYCLSMCVKRKDKKSKTIFLRTCRIWSEFPRWGMTTPFMTSPWRRADISKKVQANLNQPDREGRLRSWYQKWRPWWGWGKQRRSERW